MSGTQAMEQSAILIDTETAIETLDPMFAKALGRAPDALVEADYRIGGHPVRMRMLGREMAADVDKALCHLRSNDGAAPALTVEIWDDAAVGPVGWEPWSEGSDTNGTVSLAHDDRYVLTQRPTSAMLLDRKESRIVGGIRGRQFLHQDERVRPFHRLISIWLDDNDIQFVHAALIAHGEKGLLLVGKSGSGKSTSAIASMLDGFTFLSDDYVALGAGDDGKYIGYSLYASCMMDNAAKFPDLTPIAQPPNTTYEVKHSVYLTDCPKAHFAPQTDLAAIVMPRVVDRPDTVFKRARTMEAMLALAPSSIWILPGSASFSLDKMEGLVTSVPAYSLELGRDYEISSAIRRLCGELEASGDA